jgi:APA family basic amino acid/polyamine antiporter
MNDRARTEVRPAKGLGPWMSLAMVVGTMIGSGIYLLPAVLAPFGANMVAAWALTIAGTMCIAFAMARLAARIEGGPTVYVTRAFGDFAAFVTMWSYIVSVWAGIAAIGLATGGALAYAFPALASGNSIFVVAGGSVVILTFVNLVGVRTAGGFQIGATLVKIVPLVAVLLFVAARAGTERGVEPLAAMPLTTGGILGAAALMLFSLTGFEVGPITSRVTQDSQRNVPRAQILGVGFTGFLYFSATVATLLILPSAIAAQSKAPYADAISPILGPIAGTLVALIAAISAFGANNALILGATQLLHSVAVQGDLPPALTRTSRNGVPYVSLLVTAAAGIVLIVLNAAPGFVSIYAFIALISAVATLLLYAMCSAAALKLGVVRGGAAVIAVLALLYSIAMFFGAGWEATKWGVALAVVGIPIRWISRRLWPSRVPEAAAAAPAE